MIKTLLTSKTFWTGIATVIFGVATVINGNTDQGVQLISTGLIAIFLKHAVEKGNVE